MTKRKAKTVIAEAALTTAVKIASAEQFTPGGDDRYVTPPIEPAAPTMLPMTAWEMLGLIDGFTKKQISALTIHYGTSGLEGHYLRGTHVYHSDVLRDIVRLGTTAAAYLQTERMHTFELVIADGKPPQYSMHVTTK